MIDNNVKRTPAENAFGTFTCGKHLRDASSCKMLYICEDSLNAAFTNMLNKLILYRNQVLKPLIEARRSNIAKTGDSITDFRSAEHIAGRADCRA